LTKRRLGDLLLETGMVSREHLQAALDRRRHTGERLGQALVSLGYLRAEAIARALADQLGLEYLESAEAAPACPPPGSIGEGAIRRYRAVPLGERAGRVVVATADPLNAHAIEQLTYVAGRPLDIAVCTDDVLERIIDRYYPRTSNAQSERDSRSLARLVPRAATGKPGSPPSAASSAIPSSLGRGSSRAEDRSGPAMATRMLLQAVDEGASELHLEPSLPGGRARARRSGLLRETARMSRELFPGVMAHIRSLAGLDLADIGSVAEGWFDLEDDDYEMSVRVRYLRMPGGDRAVLHLIDRQREPQLLYAAGIEPAQLAQYRELLRQGRGLVLVVCRYEAQLRGLLRSSVAALNGPGRLIAMLEDAPGRAIAGVLHLGWGPGRAADLRAAARVAVQQDADVIVVSGEIQDQSALLDLVLVALAGTLVVLGVQAASAEAALVVLETAGIPRSALQEAHRGTLFHDLCPEACSECANGCAKCNWTGISNQPNAGSLSMAEHVERGITPVA